MAFSVDRLIDTVKLGASVRGEADASIRVGVYLDASASPFLIDVVRRALVPRTTTGLVRVERLGASSVTVKPDTDVAIVISSGSGLLRDRVQEIVVAGVPTVVLAESSVEVPFIAHDTPMLGLIAATDESHLLASLASWVLDRTDKDAAFAANFEFMRDAAVSRVVASTSLGNLAAGALFFIPGADFPVMTASQLAMMLRLAAMNGKPLRAERAYEAAAVLVCALGLRAVARAASSRVPRGAWAVKALVGGAGTYAMGVALAEFYKRDVDYSRANEAVRSAFEQARAVLASDHDPSCSPLLQE